jgi:hypothetical protein
MPYASAIQLLPAFDLNGAFGITKDSTGLNGFQA